MKRVKRCAGENCERMLREKNKSGYCHNCYSLEWKKVNYWRKRPEGHVHKKVAVATFK